MMRIMTSDRHLCTKCGSDNIVFDEIKVECDCGADSHLKKTCKVCGFESCIHRFVGMLVGG